MPIACPIQPLCGAGPCADCSAYSAVGRLSGSSCLVEQAFFARPPSLPGIGRRPAVLCFWRQTHHDVAGRGCHQATDSPVGLPGNSALETCPTHPSRAADGIVPPAPRPTAQLFGGPRQKPVLLLWLRTGRRSHPVRRALPQRGIRRSHGAAPQIQPMWIAAGRSGALLSGQLHRHPEAAAYLQQRGIHQPQIIEELAISYVPAAACTNG